MAETKGMMEKNRMDEANVAESDSDKQTTDAVPLRYPIPSNDPNDPLNWSTLGKLTTYGTICLFSFIANVNGSNFTVAIVPLQKQFKTDATHATWLVGFNVLMFGLGNVLWVPLMRVVGKRPVYLLALAVFVAANAWSTKATSYGSLLGG
ncbi:hypothetical protein LTR95_008256, partial [Oleoguttula sp. CCFEE 5521]